jgi:transcriptional antiterminator RfaH
MPLLAAEPRAFPDNLLSDHATHAERSGCWWVLYTRARMEKTLVRKLRAQDVSFYLPLYEHTLTSGGRKRSSYLPLFTGYVFLYGDESARVTALETNLLCTTIRVPDQARLYADLCRIERVLGGAAPVQPELELPPGSTVEITAGPFRGLSGKVVRRGAQTRLVVEVEFLRRGVSIEVEERTLRALPPTR